MKKYADWIWGIVTAVAVFLLAWLLVPALADVAIHVAWYLVPAVILGLAVFYGVGVGTKKKAEATEE